MYVQVEIGRRATLSRISFVSTGAMRLLLVAIAPAVGRAALRAGLLLRRRREADRRARQRPLLVAAELADAAAHASAAGRGPDADGAGGARRPPAGPVVAERGRGLADVAALAAVERIVLQVHAARRRSTCDRRCREWWRTGRYRRCRACRRVPQPPPAPPRTRRAAAPRRRRHPSCRRAPRRRRRHPSCRRAPRRRRPPRPAAAAAAGSRAVRAGDARRAAATRTRRATSIPRRRSCRPSCPPAPVVPPRPVAPAIHPGRSRHHHCDRRRHPCRRPSRSRIPTAQRRGRRAQR